MTKRACYNRRRSVVRRLKSLQQRHEVGLRRLIAKERKCAGHSPNFTCHCVWATWDRLPLITLEIEDALHKAIIAKAHELKCAVIAIVGMDDHVHVLIRFPAALAVATLVKEMKGSSSHLMTRAVAPGQFFKWQGAYGAFTVSKSGVEVVTDYVLRQKTHHAENALIEDWERCETTDQD